MTAGGTMSIDVTIDKLYSSVFKKYANAPPLASNNMYLKRLFLMFEKSSIVLNITLYIISIMIFSVAHIHCCATANSSGNQA